MELCYFLIWACFIWQLRPVRQNCRPKIFPYSLSAAVSAEILPSSQLLFQQLYLLLLLSSAEVSSVEASLPLPAESINS